MKYKVIFFDFHKTLSHSLFWEQLKDEKHPRNEWFNKISEFMFEKNNHLNFPWMRGEYDVDYMIEKVADSLKLPKATLKEDLAYSCRNMKFVSEKIPDFVEAFKSKGIKCVVATDHMDVFRQHVIPGMKLDELFDDFLISYELGKLKADIDKENKKIPFFDAFLEKNNFKYEDAILLDDCIDDGSYKEFGFDRIQIKDANHFLETLESLSKEM